jgi:hypothetical protein
MSDLKDVVNGILRDGARFAVDELVGCVDGAKTDADDSIRSQGEMLEMYIRKLARGIITKDEFEDLVQGLVDLRKIKKARIGVGAKARAERTADRFRALVLDSLLKAVKI